VTEPIIPAWLVAVLAIIGGAAFVSAMAAVSERSKTARAKLSVECAAHPDARWCDDHCERIPEP